MGNWVFLVIGALLFGFGFLIFLGSLRNKKSKENIDMDDGIEYKDGVPILPRTQRDMDGVSSTPLVEQAMDGQQVPTADLVSTEVPEEIHAADALSGLAKVAADANISQAQNKRDDKHLTLEMDKQSELVGIDLGSEQGLNESNGVQVHLQNEFATDSSEQSQEQKEDAIANITRSELNFDNRAESDFTQSSPVLDEHFIKRAENDRNNEALLNHKRTVTLVLRPQNPFDEITGLNVLEVTHAYGMKYGIMNMFHRYERDNGTGDLWFSMLGVGHDGVRPFDLNTLPDSKFRGLALFVPLPHPDVHRAFSSMVSVAQMMMADLNAKLHDEAGNVLSATDIQALKNTLDD